MIENEYRHILREALVERCRENPQYSLRAFARDLELAPSQLSRVLNGRQNISVNSAKFIADKIFKDEIKKEQFLNLVEYSVAKKQSHKNRALQKIEESSSQDQVLKLQLEHMKFVADWYHLAILELLTLTEVPQKPNTYANYLGITEIEVKDALERMHTIGVIKKQKDKWVATAPIVNTPTGIPNKSLREHHRQLITKAIESIETQNIDERYLRGKTMAMPKRNYTKLVGLIEDFMSDVSKTLKSTAKKDSIYQLNVQLFDLKNRRKP